jgi:outer membrane protein TolC
MALLAALSLALSGCASFSPDQGMGIVAAIASDGVDQPVVKIRNDEDAREAQATVRTLLRRTLTADRAVQIALLNNKGLQAAYNELAIVEASGVEASLPPSPTLSLARLTAGPELEIERMILVNVLGLLTLPAKREIAERQFRQAQFAAATETLRIAVEAKRAFYRAVASGQTVTLLAEAKETAESASELIKRLGESGAVSKLDQAREHVFYAEITGQLAPALFVARRVRGDAPAIALEGATGAVYDVIVRSIAAESEDLLLPAAQDVLADPVTWPQARRLELA